MFAQGDEVTEPSFSLIDKGDTGSVYGGQQYLGIPAPTSFVNTYDIIADDAGQYYAKKDDMVIPIDMSMGSTPRDAFKNMEKIKGIDGLVNSAITVASLIAVKRPMGNVATGIGSKFVKPGSSGYTSITAEGTKTVVPKIANEITPFGKGVLGITGGVGVLTGSQSLIDSAEQSIRNETQEALDNLTEPNVVNAKVVASEKFNTEVPSKSDIDNKDEEKNKELTTEELFEEYKKQTNPKQFQTKFLDSPNFLRFLKNVSTGLATAPDMATGLATGAAMAAEERFEEEKLSGQASEFDKFLAKEGVKNINKFKDKEPEYAANLSESIFEVETSDAVLKAITDAKKLVQTGDATGLIPLLGEYWNEARRFSGMSIELSTREAAKNFINDIINGNIKELTGESGRTISNLDRQIAGSLVGKIEWSTSKENVLDKLDKAYARAKSRYKLGMTNYESNLTPYTRYNTKPPFELGKSTIPNYSFDGQERTRISMR